MSSDSFAEEHRPADQGNGSPCAGPAAEALRRAKAELRVAQDFYHDVRRRASEQIEAVRKTTVGDLLDGAMVFVKRHPGSGLFIAAAAGFFLGRTLKR
jgi:ElaB/YqjD/DUF883 family membrane-anchored ribosome-binding protein